MPFAAKRAGELVQFRPDGAWGITRISGRLEWSRGGRFAPSSALSGRFSASIWVVTRAASSHVGEGSETWRPMGIAVIGGMVFSTIITMIIVPAVYAAMDKSGSRDKKKILSKQFKFMADFDPERDLPKKK